MKPYWRMTAALVFGSGMLLAGLCFMSWLRSGQPDEGVEHGNGEPGKSVSGSVNDEGELDSGRNDAFQDVIQNLFLDPAAGNPYADWSAAELMAEVKLRQGDSLDRRKMLWALCFMEDSSVIPFLSSIVSDANENEYLRAVILEGLAVAGRPGGCDLAIDSLQFGSDVVVRGAIRALGRYGDENAVEALSQLVFDFEHDPGISMAAAVALGDIGNPQAAKTLTALFERGVLGKENDAIEFALLGLGKIDSPEITAYMKDIYGLAADPEIRILVLEGLEGSERDTSDITRLAMMDESADVRAAAAWTLACADETSYTTDELMVLMDGESDAEVRRNLYLALDNQDELDVDRLMAMVRQEVDSSTQLAGYQLMCRQLMNIPEESYEEFSGNLRAGLMMLKNGGPTDPVEMRAIDRMIDRVDSAGSQ